MFQNSILEGSRICHNNSPLFSSFRSAFRPISQNLTLLTHQMPKTQHHLLNQKQPSVVNLSKGVVMDSDCWERKEIEKLFKLYDYYGPQWKIISLQIANRTPNNLKNRFYTILRNLIKLLFRNLPESCPKVPGEIASKDLSRLYDGKEDYFEFKSLLNDILKKINYDLTSNKIEELAHQQASQIERVYCTIYADRNSCFNKRPSISEKTTEPEKVLQVTSLPDKKIFSMVPESPSTIPTSSSNMQVSECMYVFFFKPVEIQIAGKN